MATLPISDIVDISIVLSPSATTRNGFNLGLIVGASTVIGVTERVREYFDTDSMIVDGFAIDSAEYKAATLYFSATKRPNSVLIGQWVSATESIVEALMDCRAKNTEWYSCLVCGLQKANILLLAAYIETAIPSSVLFYTTADADVLTKGEGNVMATLQGSEYMRTIGQYSTHSDAIAAIMGYAMGANTGMEDSAYTLAYKKEVGVITETLSLTQVNNVKLQNGNIYINRGNTYNLFEQGVMANGYPFDEIIGIDMLVNDIELSVMDLLVGSQKVPQTEDGVSMIVSAIISPCISSRDRGFIAPGAWDQPSILTLKTGDTLSQGFAILSKTISSQSSSDRAQRVAPPIYVCAKLAGAIEFVKIQLDIAR